MKTRPYRPSQAAREGRPHFRGICGAALLTAGLAFAAPASADDGPRIERIEILVLRVSDHEVIATLQPGGTLDLEVGQTVRLRMSAIGGRGGARYPSTRFEVTGGRRLVIEGANEDVGNVTVTAFREEARRDVETMIRYQINEPSWDIPKRLESGEIHVRVREEPVAPPPPPPAVEFSGIILYEEVGFRGRAQNFTVANIADLEGTSIGGDRASSLRLQPGCRAVLYEDRGFRGRVTTATDDVADLGHTALGDDRLSSFELDCGGVGQPGRRRGVTLYSEADFRGDSTTFDQDVANLRGTDIREDRASSARIDPGCQAILYTQPDFRGDPILIDRDVADFARDLHTGNDAVSSLTVECRN